LGHGDDFVALIRKWFMLHRNMCSSTNAATQYAATQYVQRNKYRSAG